MVILIEWIDEGLLKRGVLKKEDKGKIQVLSLTGRSVALRANRFRLRHDTRDEAETFFAAVDREAAEADPELLYESLEPGGLYALEDLAAAWYGGGKPSSFQLSVMLAAAFRGTPFLRADPSGRVKAAAKEEIARREREEAARRETEAERDALAALLAASAAVEAAPAGKGRGPGQGIVEPAGPAAAEADADADGPAQGAEEGTVPAGEAGAPPDRAPLEARLLESLGKHLLEDAPLEEWPALAAAVEKAAVKTGLPGPALVRRFLSSRGAMPSDWQVHMERFLRTIAGEAGENPSSFPRDSSSRPGAFSLKSGSPLLPGRDIGPEAPLEEIERIEAAVSSRLGALSPPRNGCIFSVDDEDTEEIDDALSVEALEGDRLRAGVHIAAPGLFIPEESAVHAAALRRLTTVYQPDLKWTMLPRRVIGLFSLTAGRTVPAVSFYFTVDRKSLEILDGEVRIEAVTPAANLAYEKIEAAFGGEFLSDPSRPGGEGGGSESPGNESPGGEGAGKEDGCPSLPGEKGALPGDVEEAIALLLPLARRLFQARLPEGERPRFRKEYRIKASAAGEVTITERRRGGIAEGIVTEMMILANGRAARILADGGLPAIYRTQRVLEEGLPGGGAPRRLGRADLTVNPRGHAGLGAGLYCWITSPLRRYADLINQRQLGSLAGGFLPAFEDASELLVRAKKMEFRNQAAAEHQKRMERHFVLKYIEARPDESWPVFVERREREVRIFFDTLPLCLVLPPNATDLPSGPNATATGSQIEHFRRKSLFL